MADIDTLPKRGIPALALVDSTGIASNGSQTLAQLAARGMRAVCAVDGSGVSQGGATVAVLAQRGIRAFCPVDELGVAADASTADILRRRGIRPMVLLGANGLALTGSATMLTLAQRGLQAFCPVDEAGNATTMGAVILVTNTSVLESATIGTNVGVLSVAGGTGTYTFSLTDSAGGKFAVAGTNGVNLNTAAALNYEAVTSHNITVSATNGGTPITRTIVITVVDVNEFVPVITSNGGGATAAISVAENTTAVTTVTATDADTAATIIYSITGGADASKFAIGSSSGVLTFVTPPDYEVPTDADANRQYIVIVQASDGTNTDTQTITVTVTNVMEGDETDPFRLFAGAGTFTFAGEGMEPISGYLMPTGTGTFDLIDPGTTQMTPPALTLSMDGIVMGNSAHPLVLPALVTTMTNNVIVVTVRANSALVTAVSGSTLGAFTRRGAEAGSVHAFWKLATTPLAGEVITITAVGSSYISGRAFAVNGSKTSAPFDVNPSCPTLTAFGGGADPANLTVTAASTLVYAVWSMSGESDPAAGSGYTRIPTTSNSDYTLHEYQKFSSNGTKSVTIGTPGVGGSQQGFLDAIVAGP